MNNNLISDINSLKNKLNSANNKKLYKTSDLNRMLRRYVSLKNELKDFQKLEQRKLKINQLKTKLR